MGRYNDVLRAAVSSLPDSTAVMRLGDAEINLSSKPLRPLDLQNIKRQHPDFMTNPSLEGMVDLIIAKAVDTETGSPAFDARDKPFLMRLDTNTVTSAFGSLFGSQLETTADDSLADKRGN